MKQSLIKRRSVFLLGQLLVLLFCIGYVNYIYYSHIKPEKRLIQSFQKTECFLLSKKLSDKNRIFHQYRADFRVSYDVNNVQYTRWVSGTGLDNSYTSNETNQEEMLEQYDDGGTYPCWYDPEEPGKVVLIKQSQAISGYTLVPVAIIFILTFYFFLKQVSTFFCPNKKHNK